MGWAGQATVHRAPGVAAITAREAEVLGKPPRIAPAPIEQVDPDAWAMVGELRAAIGLDTAVEFPGYSLTLVKHPGIFGRRLEMGMTLFGGRLPARERELAVLRVGWLLGAPYRMGRARRHRATPRRYERGDRTRDARLEASGWTRHEAAILRAVEQMLSNQTISDETWAILAKTWSEQQLLEFPMLVGQYACAAIVQNTLRVRLESGNPGLSHR